MSEKDICKKIEPKKFSKKTISALWGFLLISLMGTVVAEIFIVEKQVKFAVESYTAFYGLLGLVSCSALIFISKFLGYVLKRSKNYYERKEEL